LPVRVDSNAIRCAPGRAVGVGVAVGVAVAGGVCVGTGEGVMVGVRVLVGVEVGTGEVDTSATGVGSPAHAPASKAATLDRTNKDRRRSQGLILFSGGCSVRAVEILRFN
jgi:hypothetical protein